MQWMHLKGARRTSGATARFILTAASSSEQFPSRVPAKREAMIYSRRGVVVRLATSLQDHARPDHRVPGKANMHVPRSVRSLSWCPDYRSVCLGTYPSFTSG